MTRAYSGLGWRKTPQGEPIPGTDQVANSAGGFAWAVDRWTRLDRFLVLGSEGGTYYIGERELTRRNANAVMECLAEDGLRTVERIVEISRSGRAAKNTPAILALAMATSHGEIYRAPCPKWEGEARTRIAPEWEEWNRQVQSFMDFRRAVLSAIPEVCRTGTHIFQFAKLVEQFRGWGRFLRYAVGEWYAQDPANLAYQAVKYRQREGYTHRDLLRLAHPARHVSLGNPQIDGVTPVHERLYNWIVRREKMAGPHDVDMQVDAGGDAERIVTAFERAMAAKTPKETAALVREYGSVLPREALNPDHLNEEVWTALLEVGMPMTALIRNLATMTRKGVIQPLDSRTTLVCEQITNAEALTRARVHPYAILLAMSTYGDGGRSGLSRGEPYTPVADVMDALDAAFYDAFGNVTPTGKRIMLALDVSGSMGTPILGGFDQRKGKMTPVALTAREGAAAMAMVTRKAENRCMTVAFATGDWESKGHRSRWGWGAGISEFDISSRRSLRDVIKETDKLPFGGTDCALPMLYASEKGIEVDAFVIYTDSETWAGTPHPSQALTTYRQKTGINARLIVVGMASNEFTIADPNDPGMLDCVGFDTAAPNVISDFMS